MLRPDRIRLRALRGALLCAGLLGLALFVAGCAGNGGAEAPAGGSGNTRLSAEEQAALERYRAFMAYQRAIQTRVARQRAAEEQADSGQSLLMWQQAQSRAAGQPAAQPQQQQPRPTRQRAPRPMDLQAWQQVQSRTAGSGPPSSTSILPNGQQQPQQPQDQRAALRAWREVQSRAQVPQ